MKTAIVTGANGFIGSHMVHRLLAHGCRVHALGRARGTTPWEERVFTALREIGDRANYTAPLSCHAVDLGAPGLPFDFAARDGSLPAETTLFHVAGDTRFTPPDPGPQHQLNVQAAVNVMRAAKGKIARAVHVSTAYVAGDRHHVIREDELECGQSFRNGYEKSKFDAEIAVTAVCREQGIPLVIVRPSIIINDRRTGRASTFTHLNALVEVVSRLQDYYGIPDGEVVSESIRLLADPDARPNLAPVDSIVPPLLQIAESPAALGKTFHLCHPHPQSTTEIVDLICDAFRVKGKLKLEFRSELPRPMSRTEEMISRSLKVYAPYLNHRCEFDLANARAIVAEYDEHFTPLDVSYLQRVIEFQRQKRA